MINYLIIVLFLFVIIVNKLFVKKGTKIICKENFLGKDGTIINDFGKVYEIRYYIINKGKYDKKYTFLIF